MIVSETPFWFLLRPGLDSRTVERQIDLDGCVNFRDLGGYPTVDGRRVRWRTLFRSDALHALTPDDVCRFRDELGMTDIVDLRSSYELENEGRGSLETEAIAFHHLPLFDGNTSAADREAAMHLSLGERYLGLMEIAREPIARVIEKLALSKGGAIYHCAAGKDRTGVISAVLLGALGVSNDLIVADYALSSENLDAIIDRLVNMKGYAHTVEDLPADTLHARPETMQTVVATIDTNYGSMAGYLCDIGVTDETLALLRSKCLD
jgi:protein-tyrosine phosphatase